MTRAEQASIILSRLNLDKSHADPDESARLKRDAAAYLLKQDNRWNLPGSDEEIGQRLGYYVGEVPE